MCRRASAAARNAPRRSAPGSRASAAPVPPVPRWWRRPSPGRPSPWSRTSMEMDPADVRPETWLGRTWCDRPCAVRAIAKAKETGALLPGRPPPVCAHGSLVEGEEYGGGDGQRRGDCHRGRHGHLARLSGRPRTSPRATLTAAPRASCGRCGADDQMASVVTLSWWFLGAVAPYVVTLFWPLRPMILVIPLSLVAGDILCRVPLGLHLRAGGGMPLGAARLVVSPGEKASVTRGVVRAARRVVVLVDVHRWWRAPSQGQP